ncbi:hypothetical protein N7471_008898 [Penicillium samsonianum]|uniref:uncharacterized protein n=1 Tax=Penicillium samsonianum TaxID=1882272 RepID=UPI002548F86D|nr:uncharacterized protein N7471_008898 [Penicillium samsonianum]KAJ6127681.1 hypothetical protein N7471_008898 [Penicillium samsonianum]
MTDTELGDGNPTQQPQFLPIYSGNNTGDDLPKATPTKMMKIKELEYDSKNPRGWAILVEYALAPLCLEKVIESSI